MIPSLRHRGYKNLIPTTSKRLFREKKFFEKIIDGSTKNIGMKWNVWLTFGRTEVLFKQTIQKE